MPFTDDPFDSEAVLHRDGCCCGRHKSQNEHDAAEPDGEELWRRAVEGAVVRALFPSDMRRRAFMKAVGSATALAAISQFFPVGLAAEALADTRGPIEKRVLRVGFIPITCATPLILAQPTGIYAKQKLTVELIKAPSWPAIRDKTDHHEYDVAHMLSPMPIAFTLGLGQSPAPYGMLAIENVNGQAITLSLKHKDKRDPKDWKGFRFAVPFEYSMHNYLLRYYLAEHGIDPDKDVTIRAVPPPQMPDKLREGALDGYLAPDPANQRAVYDRTGFIHLLSREIWEGHPCCAVGASMDFVNEFPNTYRAFMRALIEATVFASKPENRQPMASVMALPPYLNQPAEVVEQILTGTFEDGLGNVRTVPGRIDFAPIPWSSFAIWILTQMKRWGQIKGDVRYAEIAEQVCLATNATAQMREIGITPPETPKTFHILGKSFNPVTPDDYLASFKIRTAT
ncbi:MAG: CmpA/NrtA family ABC transporter substrate-binding protein [Rhodomicrobium sp.]